MTPSLSEINVVDRFLQGNYLNIFVIQVFYILHNLAAVENYFFSDD